MRIKTLNAWKPYNLALKSFYKLHDVDSPGAFEDWDIYWLAALTATRSVWDTVKKDLKGSPLEQSIFVDYNNGPAKSETHQTFTRGQRNKTLHEWVWDIVPNETTAYKWLGGKSVGSFKGLVFKYPTTPNETCDVHENLQGDDPLRLLGIALTFLHRDLSVIEVAIKNEIFKPFSKENSEKLYADSGLIGQAPDYYR